MSPGTNRLIKDDLHKRNMQEGAPCGSESWAESQMDPNWCCSALDSEESAITLYTVVKGLRRDLGFCLRITDGNF